MTWELIIQVLLQVLAKPGDKIHLKISKDLIQVTGSKETQYLIDYEANRKTGIQ
jgi:hypothetical protein